LSFLSKIVDLLVSPSPKTTMTSSGMTKTFTVWSCLRRAEWGVDDFRTREASWPTCDTDDSTNLVLREARLEAKTLPVFVPG